MSSNADAAGFTAPVTSQPTTVGTESAERRGCKRPAEDIGPDADEPDAIVAALQSLYRDAGDTTRQLLVEAVGQARAALTAPRKKQAEAK